MDVSFLIVIVQLIFLEGILSIDNAAVLGAMVAHLPDDKSIEWTPALRSFGRMLNPFLGHQRTAALRAGLLGAYIGRGLMLLIAEFIIQNPWLKIIGALYLIRLAFDNLSLAEEGEDDGHAHHTKVRNFWSVVVAVEIADLVFSLDNVVAAVALSNQFWVVMLGVALGILFMRFAAGLFSYAVEREPILEKAAYILVLAIGVELILEEVAKVEINDWARFGISIGVILFSLIYSHIKALHIFNPALRWIAEGFGNFNELIDWALAPIFALARFVMRTLRLSPVPVEIESEVEPVAGGDAADES